MSGDRTASVPLEEIVDQCVDEIAAGRLTVEQALDNWPEQRDALAPLLEVAMAMRELPAVPERSPDPERRAAFMEAIASTPQQPAAVTTERGGGWLGALTSAFPRLAAVAAPAAAIAVVALFFVLSSGGDTASASTLTVFSGGVERLEDGEWQPVDDGTTLGEGDRLRTGGDGMALVTFADGSTAALDPTTEVILETIATGETRQITLEQLSGRVWNDVAPGGAPATYVVRTADAVIEAHGTTFETAVISGVTSVVTASGLVEVAAGDDRAMVEPGRVLRAIEQRIVDSLPHVTTDAPSTLRVDGPFVASLRASNGAATGALPNGVTYQQIPGVSTTNPGDGPQILRFYDVAPGRYALVLRRIEGPRTGGSATLVTDGRPRTVELPPTLATMTVRIDIGIDGGIVSIELVDREPVPTDAATDERIVDTPRTTDAIAVSDQRAAAAPVRPSDAVRPSASPEATRPSSDDGPRDDLLAALRLDPPERATALRALLESFEREDARWALLRQRLQSNDELRRRFATALEEIGEPSFVAFVRAQLGVSDAPREDGDATDAPVEPTATATRAASDVVTPTVVAGDGATATATPVSGDAAPRDTR